MRINRSYITNFNSVLSADNIEFSSVSVSGNQTLTNTDGFVTLLVNSTSSAITITLPTAVSNAAIFTIKKIDSSTNFVTIDANASQTIDGDLTIVLKDQYNYVQIVSDGTNWVVINEFINYIW